MMKEKHLLSPSIKDAARQVGLKARFENGRLMTEPVVPRPPIVEGCMADDSDFCLWVVDGSHRADGHPILSVEQMKRAAERYRLGKSRSGKTIFWMIDETGTMRDGRIGNSWVSVMLKAREPELERYWCVKHCLFGLHLLAEKDFLFSPAEMKEMKESHAVCDSSSLAEKNISFISFISAGHKPSICIVEKEKSAVILSEVFPDYIWMATVTPMNFTLERLEPLRGCQVKLFPHTDFTMSTYLRWVEMAEEARRKLHLDISVSSILEDSTSEEQKQREIDLVDFLFPGLNPNYNGYGL